MQGHPDWRSTIAVTCSFVVILVAVVWTVRKDRKRKEPEANDTKEPEAVDNGGTEINYEAKSDPEVECTEQVKEETTPELPDLKWSKVGQIRELYVYPLKSGRGKNVKECDFTEYGISIEETGKFTLKDRMFLVYNEETGRFQTSRQYPTLILVSLSSVDESRVKLEAVGMASVIFEVPKYLENATEAVQCSMWWGEPVKCIDCGPEPAEWLSTFLTGTNDGLRLGYTMMNRRNVFAEPWKKFTEVYKELRNEDTGLFSDLASYMLMTTSSMKELNDKLERPVPTLQFRPNILVSTQEPFREDNWEWIKIGERVVIRNVKPCSRCNMVGVNPTNGVMDKEPLKTLRTQQTNPDRMSLEGNAPVMGIYCGLYIPGKVKVGDEVFVQTFSESTAEPNHREAAS
ncbi:mitochondrial amidoxime-reducing component 1-like isoform X2 [Ceratina calcarata]|uniref:Mitochondrial amidoxime-reducing component 1-like isoform X2 n=1 Tax=Ceratina calcarata TaxID=156304 RepID=A0AAJ7W871_9HYME|nr:mitochondrial amidoxime-reducing component 1-like isoform X2 [Ceratina calcarata]